VKQNQDAEKSESIDLDDSARDELNIKVDEKKPTITPEEQPQVLIVNKIASIDDINASQLIAEEEANYKPNYPKAFDDSEHVLK